MRLFGSGSSSPSPGTATSSGYEQWDGHGWPGRRAGEDVPLAGRLAELAEFVEVAHRVGGPEGAWTSRGAAPAGAVRPAPAELIRRDGASILADLDAVETWDAVVLSGGRFAVASRRSRTSSTSSRRTCSATRAPSRTSSPRPSAAGGLARTRRGPCAAPPSCMASAGSGCRTRSPTSAGRSAGASGSACAFSPDLTERMLHRPPALAPLGAIAVKQRERLDGSGSPCGRAGAAIACQARLLAAADTCQRCAGRVLTARRRTPGSPPGATGRADAAEGRGAVPARPRAARRDRAPPRDLAEEVRARLASRPSKPNEGRRSMPKVSKDVAKHDDHGPVEEWSRAVDGYTINFVAFAVDLDAAPMLRFSPGAELRPVSDAIARNMGR